VTLLEVNSVGSELPPLLETAAQHASLAVPVATADQTVQDVLARLPGQRFDSAAVLAVCAGDRLVGVVTIERLIAADPTGADRGDHGRGPADRLPQAPTRNTPPGGRSSSVSPAWRSSTPPAGFATVSVLVA
jgi:CBS domain-containing protein